MFSIRLEDKSGGGDSRREIPPAKPLKAKFSTRMVGERSIRGEVRAEALVDCMEVRMPE